MPPKHVMSKIVSAYLINARDGKNKALDGRYKSPCLQCKSSGDDCFSIAHLILDRQDAEMNWSAACHGDREKRCQLWQVASPSHSWVLESEAIVMYSNSDSVFVDDTGRPLQLRFLWSCSCLALRNGFPCFINATASACGVLYRDVGVRTPDILCWGPKPERIFPVFLLVQ